MKVNIFGVGRSGTKAVQLYLAYLLAEQYGSVHLNYEPYFWITRSGPVSFEGLIHHLGSPQFSSNKKDFSPAHQSYLHNLAEGKEVIISKFIRGNGRILPIEAITKPNYNIIVVRNVKNVLESMLYMDWDFSTVGYNYFPYSSFSFWREIEDYLVGIGEEKLQTYLEEYKSDPISRNAFYWYAMNRFALENLPQNYLIVQYEELSKLESWAKNTFNLSKAPPVNQRDFFESEKLHQQFPLEDLTNKNIPRRGQRANELTYYFSKGRGRFLRKFLKKQSIGTMVQKASLPPQLSNQKSSSSKLKVSIVPNALMDFLQKDIDKRIEGISVAT